MLENNKELSHGGRHSEMTCAQWDKNQLISVVIVAWISKGERERETNEMVVTQIPNWKSYLADRSTNLLGILIFIWLHFHHI